MRTNRRILVTLALAGLVVATGSALTGTGLTNAAGDSQLVGGTVYQEAHGATLNNVVYGFADAAQHQINRVTVYFDQAAEGSAVHIAFRGNNPEAFVCGRVVADVVNNLQTWSAICLIEDQGRTEDNATGIDITLEGGVLPLG